MQIFYYSPASCALAAHIALEETGAAYGSERVLVMTGETTQPAFLAINPKGRVPVLTLPDGALTELPAILTYLDAAYPDAALFARDPIPRARTMEWISWLASEVHPAFGQIWRPARSVGDAELFPAVQARGRENVAERFAEIESRLARSASGYLVDERFSAADASLFVYFQWGRIERFDMAAYPRFAAHAALVADRPAVRRAMIQEGMLKPD